MPYHLRERQAAWCRCGKAATTRSAMSATT